MSLDGLDISILGPAFVAGLLVLATHVPMGVQVLDRGIVFIDLAIAQIAGIGVIAADALGLEPQGWVVQICALVAALAGAMLLTWTERRWPQVQEALIGVLFVLASCLGLILLAGNPHGGEHLKDLLVGQILWVGRAQLVTAGIVSAIVLAVWNLARRHIGRLGFYMLFALSVTVSVQLVGVYLVFASLIIPALSTRGMPRLRLPVAGLLGALGYLAGLAVSAVADLPSGAVIVLTMALLGVCTALISGRLLRMP